MKTLILLITMLIVASYIQGQTKYQNDKYGFIAQVPLDWHIYAEIKDNPSNNSAIIDWGLPKVYSDLEKTSIENAVSITAYKRPDIKTTNDLIKFELKRIEKRLSSKEITDSIPYYSYTLLTEQNGLKYKSQTIFVFKNNIGYVINFTATQGTYNTNIQKFNNFVKDIQFFESKEINTKSTSKTEIRFDGLYVVKTGEINIPNNKIEIYSYLRFYEDGTLYTQAVSAYDPEKVFK